MTLSEPCSASRGMLRARGAKKAQHQSFLQVPSTIFWVLKLLELLHLLPSPLLVLDSRLF